MAPTADGGAGFDAQWDIRFIRGVRPSLETGDDRERSMGDVVAAITGEGRGPALTRVIYTESHDDVANDRVRLPEAIKPGDAGSWWSEKRATLGSALVLTSPGIPMLFQGQELLEDRWFDDTVALDWGKAGTHEGIVLLHHDLIALRRGGGGTDARPARRAHRDPARRRAGEAAGVPPLARGRAGRRRRGRGQLHRPARDGPAPRAARRPGAGGSGSTRMRTVYAPDFGDHDAFDTDTEARPMDGRAQSALVSVGPYGVVILSQDP